MGSLNPQRAYSHDVPGTVPQQQDPHIAPLLAKAHRVTDQFCEQFRCLKAEVAISEAENLELRQRLQYFLTPLNMVPLSPPREWFVYWVMAHPWLVPSLGECPGIFIFCLLFS